MNSASFSKTTTTPEIPTIIREPIDTQTEITILRSGKVLIEHFYPEDCADCLSKNTQLESFANRLDGYVVINEVESGNSNESIDMIGMDGKIVDITDSSLDYDSLLGDFCDVAIAQPRACLLRDLNSGTASDESGTTQSNTSDLNESS
jgi:hypothetical protein